MISVADARSLAVRYAAFTEADMSDHEEIAFWGRLLLEMQEKTGIDLHPMGWLKRVVADANRKLTQVALIAA